MTEKLTLADCFKYPEANIINTDTISIYTNIKAFIVYHPISDEMEYEIAKCKLSLRSIEQLTDEENIELKTLYDKAIIIAKDENTRSFESGKIIVDYLRSISVDIDGFLQSGKAVKG